MSHVLIVDDEPGICWGLQQMLQDEGHSVDVASSAEDAFDLIRSHRPDAVFLDVHLPGVDGLDAMESLKESDPDLPVVIMTAHGDLETAVRAVQSGAFDYLPKPFDLDAAVDVITRALKPARSNSDEQETTAGETLIVGHGPAMQAVFKQIAIAAASDVAVLVTGESGTGKELVARAIHENSERREARIVPLHLAALSPQLIESELFGHIRGAFTGADTDRIGALESAQGGTVFLDEVADIPQDAQVKLLRALELQEVTPVGSSTPRKVNFRVIAATNQPLADRVASAEFRRDLYYRLAVFPIQLPPLRDRVEDVEPLVNHFLSQQGGDGPDRFSSSAIRELETRQWPGNVRELRNLVVQVGLSHRSDIVEGGDLPAPLEHTQESVAEDGGSGLEEAVRHWVRSELASKADAESADSLLERIDEVIEPVLLKEVLEAVRGSRNAASQMLGIHRETLRQKLRRYGIDQT